MKKFLRCLAFLAALCVGWSANAQLNEYVYSTGIDANKWITLTDYTDVSGSGSGDSWASTVRSIGFTFPFGGDSYTQYSVNSDGNLRLGSTVTGTNNYSTPFSSTTASTNNPKINFFGCDGFLVSGTHYIHSQTFGDTLLVVEYCLGPYNSTYRNNEFQWQVHLYSNGKVEAVFASASNLSSYNSHYMGICVDATDGWIINSSGVASHFTNGVTSTSSWGSTTWPTPGTYFTFEMPVITCPRPNWLTVSNITATSATFTFSPAGTESLWLGTITDGNTTLSMPLTDTVLTLPMLTPNTEYTVGVRAFCGVGDTSSARTATFRTPCVPLTLADLPYTEDFEAYGSGSSATISPCWTKGTNGSTAYPYPYSSNAITGTRSLYFYGYKPSSATGTLIYSYAALPELAPNLDASSLTLRFNAKRYSSTTVYYRSLVQVGVMTDPTDITTFEPVDTTNLTSLPASTVVYREVNLANYTGTGKYIAFYVPYIDTSTSYSYNYIYVDDVELIKTPTCPRPTAVAASNITTTSATITVTPAGSETIWLATVSDGNTSFTQTFTNAVSSLTGLTPNTEYTVSIRAFCTVGDTSEVTTTTFHTECTQLTTADLPYTEDFEAYGSGSSYPISHCWTKWTNSTTAYPYPSSTAAINGTRGLYFYGYKPTSTGTYTYSYAALPELATTVDVSNLTLRFNAKRYSTVGTYYRSLMHVGVMTDPTDIATFDTLTTVNLTPTPSGTVVNVELELTNYTGNGKYIAFYVPYIDTTGSYSYNYVYLDDVELLVTPTCHRPHPAVVENITNNSATIHWQSYSPTDNNFVVAYGRGTDPSLMTTLEVNDTIVTLTGLSEAATYNVFVKTVCNPLDMSEWSIMTSFTTHQSPIVVNTANPFFENFENEPAWMLSNGSTNKWYIGNAVSNGGENSLYISNNSGAANSYGISMVQWSFAQKALTLAAGDYVVNFDWKANGEGNYDYLRAFLVPQDVVLTGDVSPTGDNPYNFRSVTPTGWISLDGSSKLNQQTTWQHRTDTATITTAGNYNLVFLWTNDGSGGTQPPAAVDNVKVQYLPANATTVILANADPTMGYIIPEPGTYYFATGDTMSATAMQNYGYLFDYWELNAGLIQDSITTNSITQVVPAYLANMTINATAHFNPRTFTVTVASNNPILGSVTGSGSFNYLDTATITATPNSGFRFLGWNDGDTHTTRTIVVTSDSAFTALFDYQPVTVTLSVANPSMGTTIPAPGTYTFSVGDTMRATAIPNQYHRFVSWTLSAMGMNEDVTMNPVSEVVPLFLAGLSFNITCNFEEYHLPAFDSIYDFENAAADSVWTLVNGTATNQWVINSAASNGGSRSLYISNDGGTTNAYTNNSTSFTYAELGGWMEPGIYNISYDWRANGESNYDYLRVFLAPIDYVFTAGQTPIGTTSSNGFLNTVPEGLIPLDGAVKKNLSSSFSTFTANGVPIATRGEYKIVFMWANDNSSGSQPPAAIDNIVVEMPTCPAPTSLTASNVTANGATLSWFGMPGITNYTVEYGYDTTAATMMSVAGTTATITGLIDNTTYYYRVGNLCDGSTVYSPWATFITPCAPIAAALLPYSENFDSYTTSNTAATGIEPDCWTLAHRDVTISSNSYLPQIYYSSSYAHSGNYSLRLYYRCIYALPAIDTNISALQMSFWVNQTSTSYRMIVGVMSDLTDETTFVPVDTIINSATSSPEYHEVSFHNYTGNGHYIAFRNITTASYNYSYNYIDDVVVDLIPTCPAPTGVTAVLTNANTATVSWTPFDTTQNNFEVAYGTGTNPDTMAFVSSNVATTTITGLNPETNYNFYVRTICNPADWSPWSIPGSVYTGYCQPAPTSIDRQGITNVTFGTGDEVVNNSQRPTSAPYYGNYYTQVGAAMVGDSAEVAITYATGYTYGTIIWVDWNKNLVFDGNEVVYVGTAPSNNPTTLTAKFFVPETQDTGVYRMRIAGADSYYDSYTGSIEAAANANPCPTSSYTIVHDYSLHVMTPVPEVCQIIISGADSYGDGWNGGYIVIAQDGTAIDTFTVDEQSTTDTINVDNSYPVVFSWNSGSYDSEVSFTIQDGTGATAYNCSDGSSLPDTVFYTMNTACPSCFIPTMEVTSLSTTSATISWTDDNNGATYTVYSNNAVVATGITANTYTFTGLTENTDYTFGVVANCSATDASDMATASVHTPCSAVAVPFYESFDTASATLGCWTAYSMNTANSVSLSLFNGDGIALRFSSYSSASDYNQYAFSPVFNYTGNESSLNLNIVYATYGSGDHLWFGYITPTDTVWTTDYYTTTGESDVQTYTANIPATATQIAFHYYGSYAYYAWIDSVSVTVGASCLPVTNLTVDSIGTYSASISWTGDGSSYTIYNGSTVVATGVTTTNYTFTGLTASTDYTFGVEAYCPYGSPASIVYVNAHTLAEPIMCGDDLASIFANADSATSTVNYFPAYSLYDYSYSEVIIPSERLTGLGEIKGMEFKPTNVAAGSSHMTNCDIYLMHTSATSLSDGFIQDTDNFQLVFSGNLSYDNTNWQTITFDSSFTWNGFDNVLVAVHRNDGSWASSGSFESFSANSQLARYVYRDNTPYTIGEITGGTATNNVPVYHLIGCEGQAPAGVIATIAVNDTTMGTTVPAPGTYTFNVGDTMGALAIANTGYHFDYWTVAALGLTDTITLNPIADVVPAYLAGVIFDITANFAPNVYTITATSANTTMGTVTGGGSYAYGTTATLTATPATGYHFVQWNDADTHATRTVTVTGDATYTATFAYNPLTVTLAVNDTAMGTTNPAPGTYTYNVGDTVTVSAIAATGHSFQTWVIPGVTLPNLTDNTITVIIPAEMAGLSISATAQFAINSYTINVVANDSTRGSVSGSGTYTYGTVVTLTATPAQHYYLVQWSDGDTNLTRTITVTHDATYTAIFRALPHHTVTLNTTGGGSVSGTGVYYEDDMVTITATPDEYYAFVNWVDNDNNIVYTEPTVTFPMGTTDIILTAVFEQVVFEATLDVTVNNIEWGHVLINGERADRYHGHTGDTVVLQAVAHDGYHFDHWDGVHPINDTVPGETITIVLTEPATDVLCFFAENIGINEVVEDNTVIYTKHNNIVVSGAEQQTIRVFDVVGRLVAQRSNAAIEETIPMPATGVYLVKVGDRPARRVVVRK